MKFVTKMVLIPIENWEKVKKHLPTKNILSTVEVDQMTPVKQEQLMMNSAVKQVDMQKKKRVFSKEMERKKKNAISIINYLPKKYRSKAFSLFRYILKNYNMSWDNKGTFKYKNKIIPKSNILHLVTHALLKDVKDKPPGMKQFYEGLSDVNVPEYLVANKMGKLIIEGRGDELTLKTPTHLVNKNNYEELEVLWMENSSSRNYVFFTNYNIVHNYNYMHV